MFIALFYPMKRSQILSLVRYNTDTAPEIQLQSDLDPVLTSTSQLMTGILLSSHQIRLIIESTRWDG